MRREGRMEVERIIKKWWRNEIACDSICVFISDGGGKEKGGIVMLLLTSKREWGIETEEGEMEDEE